MRTFLLGCTAYDRRYWGTNCDPSAGAKPAQVTSRAKNGHPINSDGIPIVFLDKTGGVCNLNTGMTEYTVAVLSTTPIIRPRQGTTVATINPPAAPAYSNVLLTPTPDFKPAPQPRRLSEEWHQCSVTSHGIKQYHIFGGYLLLGKLYLGQTEIFFKIMGVRTELLSDISTEASNRYPPHKFRAFRFWNSVLRNEQAFHIRSSLIHNGHLTKRPAVSSSGFNAYATKKAVPYELLPKRQHLLSNCR